MEARYYIYRNLRTGGFSVKYRGKVIDRLHTFAAYNAELKVNELGRQRVIKEGQKNVHAYVVCDKYESKKYPILKIGTVDKYKKITYNPYRDTQFVCRGKKIYKAKRIVFQNGQCFDV